MGSEYALLLHCSQLNPQHTTAQGSFNQNFLYVLSPSTNVSFISWCLLDVQSNVYCVTSFMCASNLWWQAVCREYQWVHRVKSQSIKVMVIILFAFGGFSYIENVEFGSCCSTAYSRCCLIFEPSTRNNSCFFKLVVFSIKFSHVQCQRNKLLKESKHWKNNFKTRKSPSLWVWNMIGCKMNSKLQPQEALRLLLQSGYKSKISSTAQWELCACFLQMTFPLRKAAPVACFTVSFC